MKELMKSFGKFFLCALPIGFVFWFLNSSLILWKETSYQYGFGFWMLMFVFASAIAFVFAIFGITSKLISEKIFKTKNVDVIIKNALISIFLALFIATIFYPCKGIIFDGGAQTPVAVLKIVGLVLLHLSVAAIFLWVSFKQKEIFKNLCVIALVISLGISAIYMFKFIGLNFTLSDVEKTEISFSKNENVIILVADMLQGQFVENVFEEWPELKKDFKDFDVFTRATSVFNFTNYSVPSMLSGKIYASDNEKLTDFENNIKAMKSDSFLTDAKKKGWGDQVLSIVPMSNKSNVLKLTYKNSPFNSFLTLSSASLGRLFSFVLPHDKVLDILCYQKKLGHLFIKNYNNWVVKDNQSKVSFFHLLTTHLPVFSYKTGLNGKVDYKIVEPTKENIFSEINVFMSAVGESFEKLKALGIYDSSTIVVLGDHGNSYCANPELAKSISDKDRDNWTTSGFWNRPACMHNPVVMVKLPNQKYSEPKFSQQTVSLINLRKFVNAVINKEKDPLKKFMGFYSEKGNPVVLVNAKDRQNEFFLKPNFHKTFYIKGNAHKMGDVMFHPSALENCYIKVPMQKYLTMNDVSLKIGLKLEDGAAAWLHDKRGVVLFEVDPSKLETDLNIKIDFSSAMVNEKHPIQRIFVDFYDERVASFEVKSTTGSLEFKIPADWVKEKQGKVFLNFSAPDCVTPKSIGAWDYDQSKLSLLLSGILLGDEKPFANYFLQNPVIPSVSFGKRLTMDKFASTGNFVLEKNGGWIHGNDGAIVFRVKEDKIDSAIRVKVDYNALVNENHPKQRVFVDFYDKPLASFDVVSSFGVLEFDISKELIQEKNGVVLINFRTPDVVTPKSIGAWDYDATSVGLYLKSFLLENK